MAHDPHNHSTGPAADKPSAAPAGAPSVQAVLAACAAARTVSTPPAAEEAADTGATAEQPGKR